MILESQFVIPDYMQDKPEINVNHLAAKRIADDIALQILKNFPVSTSTNDKGETVKEMKLEVTSIV